MKRTGLFLLISSLFLSPAGAQQVREFRQAGPFAVTAPVGMDTVNVSGQAFDEKSLLDNLSLSVKPTATFSGQVLPSLTDQKSVGLLTFYINNADFVKGTIQVKGPRNYRLFVDGSECHGEVSLAPEHHTVALKYLAEPNDSDSISVTMDLSKTVQPTISERHPYMVHDLTDGRRVRSVSLSADGQYVAVGYQTTERGGQSRWDYELRDVKTGRIVSRPAAWPHWLPRSVAWLEEATEGSRRVLYRVDPLSGERTLFASDVPEGGYTVSPTEDYLIISGEEEGPKEDADVYEVVEMDDRQPGWRTRRYLSRYDLKTGITQRLTFGSQTAYLEDISSDGTRLLVGTSYSRLAKRPTEVGDAYIMDMRTLSVDTLFVGEGFIGGGSFSPDGSQILFKGTPEAFNRIGCQLPPDVTPSMTEGELFLFDIATRRVTPLTRDFDPSVETVDWSRADGLIYFSAEDRDYVNVFVLNPRTGQTTQLPVDGDYCYRWEMASQAPVLAYLTYKTMEPASAHVMRSDKGGVKSDLLLFDGSTALGDAEIGTCQDWNFTNSRGDTVYGRLYLPRELSDQIAKGDSSLKKYPMIVYYYGGCSPVSRYFESPYAPQMWNSLGYVAYIIEPSGATGFGQEWASRHVNTAGRGPADDIIEGVKRICDEHPFIDREKIGCMGASYGGFMTQYLQTQTDIFAAAVSHAGITNHTSYWGVGYWGYNYSEVSMANSYPWSHRDLYVNQSPLFNADKIHTPLLLLHGDADTNVPLVESLQMFTALKLLGREVALVQVKGENHHILDYAKKEKWLATQMAWFQRWLKDDPSWWDALYPKKHL